MNEQTTERRRTPPHVWALEPWSTDLAHRLAAEAHAGVLDKVGVAYIEHPETLARLVAPWGPVHEQVALLHDVVEDTEWTLEELAQAGAPEDVLSALVSVTKRPKGQETREQAVRRAGEHPVGKVVKAADNAHNGHPGRLARVPDPATRERLTRKYAEDRAILDEYDAPHFTL